VARSSGANTRSAAAGKPMYGGFWLKFPYPVSLRSEPRYDFPTQHLPSSVPTIERSVSSGVLGLSRKHTARIAPLATQTTRGGYGRCRADQPVPVATGNRQRYDRRDGRSDTLQPVVAMVLPHLPRKEGKAYAGRRATTGGRASISDKDVRGSSRGLRRPQRGVFACLLPPRGPARPESHESLG
jgi:hypothetical protein